ncbi:hypothetical protein N7534_003394 [Penicillium rubens]|nr:hypothetical protein N7534_003394 [Penicillium rubens]
MNLEEVLVASTAQKCKPIAGAPPPKGRCPRRLASPWDVGGGNKEVGLSRAAKFDHTSKGKQKQAKASKHPPKQIQPQPTLPLKSQGLDEQDKKPGKQYPGLSPSGRDGINLPL